MKKEKQNKIIEDWDREEWGGWKIVSKMLDNPDKSGIYPTSKCYQELYDFVVTQKQRQKQKIIEKIDGKNGLVEGEVQIGEYYIGYNKAIQDIIRTIIK